MNRHLMTVIATIIILIIYACIYKDFQFNSKDGVAINKNLVETDLGEIIELVSKKEHFDSISLECKILYNRSIPLNKYNQPLKEDREQYFKDRDEIYFLILKNISYLHQYKFIKLYILVNYNDEVKLIVCNRSWEESREDWGDKEPYFSWRGKPEDYFNRQFCNDFHIGKDFSDADELRKMLKTGYDREKKTLNKYDYMLIIIAIIGFIVYHIYKKAIK